MITRGVGVDTIEIARIQDALDEFGDQFRRRIFTDGEQAYCRSRRGSEAASLAVRWAAKEAFAKCIRLDPAPRWVDVEVMMVGGRPLLRLSHALGERLGPHRFFVSLSHDRISAVAFAVFCEPQPGDAPGATPFAS